MQLVATPAHAQLATRLACLQHSYSPNAGWQATLTSLARRRRLTSQAPALGRRRQPLVGQGGQAYGARARQARKVTRQLLRIACYAHACLGKALPQLAHLRLKLWRE